LLLLLLPAPPLLLLLLLLSLPPLPLVLLLLPPPPLPSLLLVLVLVPLPLMPPFTVQACSVQQLEQTPLISVSYVSTFAKRSGTTLRERQPIRPTKPVERSRQVRPQPTGMVLRPKYVQDC
jgi:hypothetical protein